MRWFMWDKVFSLVLMRACSHRDDWIYMYAAYFIADGAYMSALFNSFTEVT